MMVIVSFIRRALLLATLGLSFTVVGHAAAAPFEGGDSRADAVDVAVTIEVPEVDCAACNIDVRKALKGAGGVRRLDEGSPKNRIVVTYEPGTGRPGVYVEALHKAGFAKAHVVG